MSCAALAPLAALDALDVQPMVAGDAFTSGVLVAFAAFGVNAKNNWTQCRVTLSPGFNTHGLGQVGL